MFSLGQQHSVSSRAVVGYFLALVRSYQFYKCAFFVFKTFFKGSFRFIAKLGGRYRDFPHASCPHVGSFPHCHL